MGRPRMTRTVPTGSRTPSRAQRGTTALITPALTPSTPVLMGHTTQPQSWRLSTSVRPVCLACTATVTSDWRTQQPTALEGITVQKVHRHPHQQMAPQEIYVPLDPTVQKAQSHQHTALLALTTLQKVSRGGVNSININRNKNIHDGVIKMYEYANKIIFLFCFTPLI